MQQPINQRSSLVSTLLMLVIIVLLGILVFQNQSNKSVQVQSATPTATPVQPTATLDPIVSIQIEIDKLKSEVNDMKQNNSTGMLDFLVVSVPMIYWLVLIIFLVLIFLKPLIILVHNIAGRASNSVIEINSVKFGSNEAGNAIEQREILKIALKLSNADKGDAEENELYFIGQLADDMDDGKKYLNEENKFKVLSVAIKVALMDAEFSETEYEEIMIQANDYNLSSEYINRLHDKMLSEMLIRRHNISSDDSPNAIAANDVIPPPQLKSRYERAKININAQLP